MPSIGADFTTGHGRAAGFTLLELLVVLVVLSFMLSLTPPLLSAALPQVELRAAANDLAVELRAARVDAITRQSEVAYSLHVGKGKITAIVAPSAQHMPDSAMIRFFPDGSSSGGRVILGNSGREMAVAVHWLTGRVSIDDGKKLNR